MNLDISRDYLDGVMLQQPGNKDAKGEIRASGQLHFLPSSPDGTMHTAVVAFALTSDNNEQPFARAGWRFLFTSSTSYDPKVDTENQFFGQMMMIGMGKIMAILNSLCLHANMPLVPFEPSRMSKPTMTSPEKAGGAGGKTT
jgi:hypothetical protein